MASRGLMPDGIVPAWRMRRPTSSVSEGSMLRWMWWHAEPEWEMPPCIDTSAAEKN